MILNFKKLKDFFYFKQRLRVFKLIIDLINLPIFLATPLEIEMLLFVILKIVKNKENIKIHEKKIIWDIINYSDYFYVKLRLRNSMLTRSLRLIQFLFH